MTKIHPMTCHRPKGRWPVRTSLANPLIGKFGPTRNGGAKLHNGVDWICPPGSPVYAAHSGLVSRDGEQQRGEGFGTRVYVSSGEPNDVVTIYAHLSVEFVHVDQFVRAGACLGLTGRSGNIGFDPDAIPDHLHHEVHVAGVPVDPEAWYEQP